MDTLKGMGVVVTGGLGVLGLSVGQLLLQRGARVVLLDLTEAGADAEAVDGMTAVLGGIDLANADAARSALAQADQALGGMQALVNVAGGFAWEKIEQGRIATWERMFTINLRTAVNASEAALPHLLKQAQSAIVNVGALAAAKAGIGMGAYAASKAGVARLTEAMAEEFKDRGLRVNAVLPSVLDTPTNRADMPDADASRWVAPDALGAVIAFLLSSDARAINGACIPVNGRV